jgi:membrane protease YdiL (CAAX protease family)
MGSTSFLLLLSIFSYLFFFKAMHHAWMKRTERIMNNQINVPGIFQARHLQITGIILLGLPVLAGMPGQIAFQAIPGDMDHYLIGIILLLSIIVFAVSWFFAVQKIKQFHSFHHPFISCTRPVASYFLIRIIYLVVYEFFFRGILLFNIVLVAGILISVSINIILYVIIHLFDDRSAIIGAVPFGVVMCWLSWETKSVWPAVLLHLVLALTSEIKIFYHLFQSSNKVIT